MGPLSGKNAILCITTVSPISGGAVACPVTLYLWKIKEEWLLFQHVVLFTSCYNSNNSKLFIYQVRQQKSPIGNWKLSFQ